jgi:flagellar biosynthesis protein FlhB
VPRERLAERVGRAGFACAKWMVLVFALVAPWSDAVRGMIGAWQRAPSELLPIAGGLVVSLFERAAIVLAALGVIDFGVQQALFRRRLKMSRQQLQEEQRATEADPHATAERRRRAREQQATAVLQELAEVAYVVCDLEGRAFALREKDGELALWIVAEGDLAARMRAQAIARGLSIAVNAELAVELRKFEIGETLPPAIAARLQLPGRT